MKNNLKSRDQNLVVQELGSETLIYDRTINKAYCLNETAAFVWKSLDGKTEVQEIAADLGRKTKTPVSEEIVWLAIDELKKDNLLANADDLPNYFEGMNRREVVRRIGLASMIALPVIASLVAPTAAMAQSGTNCGTTTPVASGCPVGLQLQNSGQCTDTAATDAACNSRHGSGGFSSPRCVGAANTRTCTQTTPTIRTFFCKCA